MRTKIREAGRKLGLEIPKAGRKQGTKIREAGRKLGLEIPEADRKGIPKARRKKIREADRSPELEATRKIREAARLLWKSTTLTWDRGTPR